MKKDSLKDCIKKASPIGLYIFFGVLTTAFNTVLFFLMRNLGISLVVSTVFAWVLSVLFAFVTNRRFVFHGKQGHFFQELCLFFFSRLFSGVLDLFLMKSISLLSLFDETLLKFLVNIVVIAVNYVLSKLVVFRRRADV